MRLRIAQIRASRIVDRSTSFNSARVLRLGMRASFSSSVRVAAYYRRVVENQKGRLIEQIAKVAKRVGATDDTLRRFEAAAKETQFSKAIDMVKDCFPESLLIDGHNPLV